MANAAGWQSDPEQGDQECDRRGSARTDRVGPTERGGSSRVPEHGPQLHRALAAATADIDAVESRLSTLFERSQADPKPAWSPPPPVEPVGDDDAILDLDGADEPDPARRTLFRRRT